MTTSYKKKYTIKEFYYQLHIGVRTIKHLIKGKRNGTLSKHFIERIMLAVTEVNGCSICSYGHTKIALEQGMSEEEINMLLSGSTSTVPNDEVKAIMFAQHYADTKGYPTKDSWQNILETYGEEKALGILSTIRMIMIGNSYLITLGALKSRFSGKPLEDSHFIYELTMTLSIIPLLPVAIIHAILSSLLRKPLIK